MLRRVLLMVSAAVCLVGVLDAAIGDDWDLLVLFAIAASIQAALLLVETTSRIPTTIRPDLAQWVEDCSQRSGEPASDIIDRAIAWRRDNLYR